jgi:chromate reductase, NAD(P)H dehydrogenase (quinone)
MSKIIIISATSRLKSNTMRVSRIYRDLLKSKKVDCDILDLNRLPENFVFEELHGKRSEAYAQLISDFISANHQFLFIAPEYNGSFPGVLKLFIDSIHPTEWKDKYACLVGVSLGRAGNLRGLEHLASILNYLKMHVYHNKLPISVIDTLLDKDGKFNSEDQLKACENQLDGFLKWTKNINGPMD